MNEVVKKAYEKNKEECEWNCGYLPDVEVGENAEINDIWDGNGENPTETGCDSVSYKVTDSDWINYCFEVVEKKERELDTIVKITAIEML